MAYQRDKNGKGVKPMQSKQAPKETVEDIQRLPFLDNKDRGIRKETCERYGVRAGYCEKDGETIKYWYFPSLNKKGKITGYMRQDVSIPKELEGHWTAIGAVVIGNQLLGQDVAAQVNRKRNNLVVTEGGWDCLSVYQAQVDSVKGTKYAGMEPFVVSIPLGTANAVESILHNEDFVASFDALTIFFDNDSCTAQELKKGIVKGAEAREAVAGALVGSGITLYTVEPCDGFKDASDYLQNGKSEDLAKLVQFDKKLFSAEKITRACEITLDELLEPQPKGVFIDCFPKLMERLNGFRLKELTMVLAPSNVGKTSACSILAHNFIKAGHKLGMIFLEEGNKETFQRLLAAELKVNYLKFKRDPLSVCTREQVEEAYNKIVQNDRLVLVNHFGSMPISSLMTKVKHMVLVEGCEYIVLDHISAVISGLESDNERKQLDMVMTELAAFCAANDVHIIVVSHINRTNAQQFLPPKGKEGEPFWVSVTKESARGSAALEQFSWNILALEPEINPDFTRGRVRWKVLKTRFGDSLGIADVFTLDQDTWEVILDEPEAVSF